jgi:hypothetical protein
MTSRRPARRLRRLPVLAALAAALYLAGAYFLAPELWWRHEHHPGLARRPMVTTTASGIPGDPVNVGLVGDVRALIAAMHAAGWRPADPVTFRSALAIGLSVALDRSYPDAPVSPLYFEGRLQDLAFEKPVGASADRRHHVRFWKALDGVDGGPLFLGAASFDRGVGFSHLTGQITHHIAPDIDAERAFLMDGLADTGRLAARYFIPGSGATLTGRNGGGDRYVTDGDILVGVLMPAEAPARAQETHAAAPPAGAEAPARARETHAAAPPAETWWMAPRRGLWRLVTAIVGRIG